MPDRGNQLLMRSMFSLDHRGCQRSSLGDAFRRSMHGLSSYPAPRLIDEGGQVGASLLEQVDCQEEDMVKEEMESVTETAAEQEAMDAKPQQESCDEKLRMLHESVRSTQRLLEKRKDDRHEQHELVIHYEKELDKTHLEAIDHFMELHRSRQEATQEIEIISIISEVKVSEEGAKGDPEKHGEEAVLASHRGEKVARLVATFEGVPGVRRFRPFRRPAAVRPARRRGIRSLSGRNDLLARPFQRDSPDQPEPYSTISAIR